MNSYRVTYRNQLDGTRRVFIAGLDEQTANAVMAKWGNPKEKNFYMGKETTLEVDPGDAQDGDILAA